MPIPPVPAKIDLMTDTFKEQVDTINEIIDVLNFSSQYHTGGLLFFEDSIDDDITIPSDKRALAIDVTIADGKTVTVSPGATFVVL